MAKNFCLLPNKAKEFRDDLKSGKLKMADLLDPKMTSEKRTEIFRKYAGSSAEDVNLAFEEKRVLKNTTLGMKNFLNKAAQMGKYSPEGKAALEKARADFRAIQQERILNPKEQEAFYNDLADKMLDTHVSVEETRKILELTNAVTDAGTKMSKDFTFPTEADRINYGASLVALENYKLNVRGSKPYGFNNPLKVRSLGEGLGSIATNTKATIKVIADNTRAIKASIDNSLWGNQGIRVLLNPKYTTKWAINFAKSFKDIGQILVYGNKKGDAILDAVKADVYSRPNALKGLYTNKGGRKLDIGGAEEEFPTSLPTKIPVLGRAFKAAETAYEAGALRLRADVADKVYKMAEKTGVDMTNPKEIGSRNDLVNSMTGRGYIGRGSEMTDLTNSAFFSVRFFKSNIDFITAHAFDPNVSASAKKEALMNILWVLSTTAVLLGINKGLSNDPGYNPFDPRSSDAGKLKIGNTRISIAPYMSIVTLLTRMVSQSTRNSLGEVKPLNEKDKEGKPKFGAKTGMDVFWDFTEGKFSPIAALIRDQARQYNFDQEKPDLKNTTEAIFAPMPVEGIKDLKNDKSADALLRALLGAGSFIFPTNTYEPPKPKEEKSKTKKAPKRSF